MRRRGSRARKRVFVLSLPRRLPLFEYRLTRPLQRAAQFFRTYFAASILALVMVAIILMLIVNFGGQVVQSARLETQRAVLAADVRHARADNLQLAAAVEYAKSDVSVERIAREQLGLARDGDIVIMPRIAPPTMPTTAATNEQAPSAPALPVAPPNWQRWWEAFTIPAAAQE